MFTARGTNWLLTESNKFTLQYFRKQLILTIVAPYNDYKEINKGCIIFIAVTVFFSISTAARFFSQSHS